MSLIRSRSYADFVLLLSVSNISISGYPNTLYNSDGSVAQGLHSELESSQIIPAASTNPAMMYALLALMGCLLNFSLFVGVGIFCLRNRRRYVDYSDHDDDVTRVTDSGSYRND